MGRAGVVVSGAVTRHHRSCQVLIPEIPGMIMWGRDFGDGLAVSEIWIGQDHCVSPWVLPIKLNLDYLISEPF